MRKGLRSWRDPRRLRCGERVAPVDRVAGVHGHGPSALSCAAKRGRHVAGLQSGRWPMLSPKAVSGDYACPA
eukprot:813021-Prymnesium_polylepis.1